VLALWIGNSKVYAEGVRTISVRSDEIQTIYLSMGKSTVVRFKERPKKVVVGNQNYFGIEYIDNDVAIQPLGYVKTNLFVYTESKTYGFQLVVGQGKSDDLVKVERGVVYQPAPSAPSKPSIQILKKELSLPSLAFGADLIVKPLSVTYLPDKKMYVLDVEVQNKSKSILKTADVTISLNRNNKSINPQMAVNEIDSIQSGKSARIRIFFSAKEKESFTALVSMEGKTKKLIVDRSQM
jgi:phage-related protein